MLTTFRRRDTSSSTAGQALVAVGVILAAAGLILMAGGLRWFGHLPGDLRIERGAFHLFVPITSMLLISAVLSLVIHLIRRFL